MRAMFDTLSYDMSRMATRRYSTSFSLGIRFFERSLRRHIYALYGFVRFADEIVDTFHTNNKQALLDKFKADAYQAIDNGISLNPILNSFALTVNQFDIPRHLINTFLQSMEMDLQKNRYDLGTYKQYIVGSAEVVGLMCLKIFCHANPPMYQKLIPAAQALGSAYQKVNFLRDLNADFNGLGRVYFPNVNLNEFDENTKAAIVADIESDFDQGYHGILQLPANSRFGVYLSYIYYLSLLQKIKLTRAEVLMRQRIRIPDREKFTLLAQSYLKDKLHLIHWNPA